MTTVEKIRKPLITDEPWDSYHLESLLALKETYRENAEFGFLLRHYWIPATILTFRQSSRTTFPDGRLELDNVEIERKMARCRSNECLWREKTRPVMAASGNGGATVISELLCSYDCYEQTYTSARPILFALPASDQKREARRQALYRLPLLCPPGPVPIGFCWYATVDDDYMNYRLDAEERIGETAVLVIRREGCYTRWVGACPDFSRSKTKLWTIATGLSSSLSKEHAKAVPVVVQRKGVTLFAWNRGVVLEDRYFDRVIETEGGTAPAVGTATQVITRLIRSCPEKTGESGSVNA